MTGIVSIRSGGILSVTSGVVSVAPTRSFATWNTLDATASVIFSNGNLTVGETGSSFQSVRATRNDLTSGKHYWEVTLNLGAGNDSIVGIRIDSDPISNIWTTGTHCSFRTGGSYFVGGGAVASGTPVVTNNNDVVMFALDLDNDRLWVGLNGTWNTAGANPETNTNPDFDTLPDVTWAPYWSSDNIGNTTQVTANFGATAFAYTVPVGFNAGV